MDDMNDMVREDVEKFRRYRGRGGVERTLPALVELALTGTTALIALVWLGSLYFVPDPIPGQMWMGIGMLGLVIVGVPAAAVALLRRGGVDTLLRVLERAGR